MTTEQTASWEDIDWPKVERQVFRFQKRIFRLSQEGRCNEMHRSQERLSSSFYALCLAVRKATEDSKGHHTAGVDGVKSLTDKQKMDLVRSLHLNKRPDPVRRVNIPKPGSSETRPLGIPTMADRAHQHLIVMALEPRWEARFSRSMFGFRKGRNCHDALNNIWLNIRCTQKWGLDADIEKFFDRIDHTALLKKLDTFPAMEKAIRRILKAGMLEGEVYTAHNEGTPQGGPLSPLLANIALTGLEDDLIEAFLPNRVIEGNRVDKPPRIIIYADDFVVLHESKAVITAAHSFISKWLKPMSLNLSPTKTRILHTLETVNDTRGFDFLGCHVQQFKVGKHQTKPFFNGIYTDISPSRKSWKRFYAECAELIDKVRTNKKRNAEYAHKQRLGKTSKREAMIHQLNRKLRGWGGYFHYHNCKHRFSKMDHLLFKKLFRWSKRRHPRWRIQQLIDVHWNGGSPWTFKVRKQLPGKDVELMRLDSIPKETHITVKGQKSWYDGDWAYWGARQGKYPGLPPSVGRCLKRQNGKCHTCKDKIDRESRIQITKSKNPKGYLVNRLVHTECTQPSDTSAYDPFVRRMTSGARCSEMGTPGSEELSHREVGQGLPETPQIAEQVISHKMMGSENEGTGSANLTPQPS